MSAEIVQAVLEPPLWGNRDHGGRDARNLAATALVAAKVYEAFGWVRWDPRSPYCDGAEYHVPDAEALLAVLYELGCRALAEREKDHEAPAGLLRFLAYADDDGDDSSVNFYLSIGDADLSEFRAIRRRVES